MSLETIVRPFETQDVAPGRAFFSAGKAAPQNIILQCGRGGGGKTFNGSSASSASFYVTQYVNEKSQSF